MNMKRALFSASAANLFLSPAWIIAFGSGTAFDQKFLKNAYHTTYELNHVDYLAGIPLIVAGTAVIYALLSIRRARPVLEVVIAAVAIAALFDGFRRTNLHFLSFGNINHLVSSHPVFSGLLFCAMVVFLWYSFSWLKRLLVTTVYVCAPLIVILVANMAYAAHLTRPAGEDWLKVERSLAPMQRPDPAKKRTLAILFDAWDYDLSFTKHQRAVHMPNIERFRRQAAFATNAQRFGGDTLRAVPSFTTGAHVVDAEHAPAFDLLLHFAGDRPPSEWSKMTTVFDLARASGANVATTTEIYHQYCFLFRRAISACYPAFTHIAHQTNMLKSMGKMLVKALPFAGRRKRVEAIDPLHPDGYVDRFLRLKRALLEKATDRRFGFVFAHLFLPHPPYYYDPATDRLTVPNSDHRNYFKQLVHLDNVFGEVRAAMERAGVWDDTNVLIFADHRGPDMDFLEPGIKQSDKVPILLKLAGQTQPVTMNGKIEARRLFYVLKELFEDRLHDPRAIEPILTGPSK